MHFKNVIFYLFLLSILLIFVFVLARGGGNDYYQPAPPSTTRSYQFSANSEEPGPPPTATEPSSGTPAGNWPQSNITHTTEASSSQGDSWTAHQKPEEQPTTNKKDSKNLQRCKLECIFI